MTLCDHSVAEATRLGKTGSFLCCSEAAEAASPPSRMSGQSLGAMSHHTTLLEQGMLSWGPSCPMEVVGRPENRLFTLAKALEQPEGQISNFVIHFNHTIVTWRLAWGEGKKHQNLLVPPPPAGACILWLVPLQLPADGISLAV